MRQKTSLNSLQCSKTVLQIVFWWQLPGLAMLRTFLNFCRYVYFVCMEPGGWKKNICTFTKAVFLEQLIFPIFSLSLSELYKTREFLGCNFLYLNYGRRVDQNIFLSFWKADNNKASCFQMFMILWTLKAPDLKMFPERTVFKWLVSLKIPCLRNCQNNSIWQTMSHWDKLLLLAEVI